MDRYKQKEIIVFDLDGTLSRSKEDIDEEMSALLNELLKIKKVAVITGGTYLQMQKALLKKLNCEDELFNSLFLFPTDATKFYRYVDGEWKNKYTENLAKIEKAKIIKALEDSLAEVGYAQPEKTYGEIIEDRDSQITFSGLGQLAPLAEKEVWDPDRTFRKKVIEAFERRISGYSAKTGGTTSIDINKKEVDKAHGIRQIGKTLNIPIKNMLFVGDALYEGGNDEAVIRTGIETVLVETPEDTKKMIKNIIN